MKRLLPILFSAYLTVGASNESFYGKGTNFKFDIEQPLNSKLSLCPYTSYDIYLKYTELNVGGDFVLNVNPRIALILGSGYNYYKFQDTEAVESINIHTAIKLKVW